jgi:hypothetical protein
MVGISPAAISRVRGDQWNFGPISHSINNVSVDLTGFTIVAAIEWDTGSVAISTVLADDDDDQTGYLWIDQSHGQYMLKVNETDTANVPQSQPQQIPQLVIRLVDANGNRFTKAIIPLDVIAT